MSDVAPVAAQATPTAPAAPPKAKRKRAEGPPKSKTVTLTSGKDTLQFVAQVTKDGGASGHVLETKVGADGKKTSDRGATISGTSLEDVLLKYEAAIKDAEGKGWKKRVPVVLAGYKPRPDAFDLASIPAPRQA